MYISIEKMAHPNTKQELLVFVTENDAYCAIKSFNKRQREGQGRPYRPLPLQRLPVPDLRRPHRRVILSCI